MDKRKYLDGVFTRINYLASMASSQEEIDVESLLIEHSNLTQEIYEIKEIIKSYTPTKNDLDSAKSKDELRLSSKKSELSDLEYEHKNLSADLKKKEEELSRLMDEIAEVKKDIQHLENEDSLLDTHTPLSREFKQFVNDNRQTINQLKDKILMLTTKKTRSQNSIDVLSDKINILDNQIAGLDDAIKNIQQDLSTDKAYENTGIIKEKKKILDNYDKRLHRLEKRKDIIENDPIYLASQLKNLLENKKDSQKANKIIDNIYNQAKAQPYMAITLRNGNAKKLSVEYELKREEYESLDKQIKQTNYSLKELPIEKTRRVSIDKLIALYQEQIELHNEILKKNDASIGSLASLVKTLNNQYQDDLKDVEEYKKDFQNLEATSIEYAHKTREHEKMLNVLEQMRKKIALYKDNITQLIKQNNQEKDIISNLKYQIKILMNEKNTILNMQMNRNNYYDVIRRNKDLEHLNNIKQDMKYIEKRSNYRHYNITTLYSEIKQGIKTLYSKPVNKIKKVKYSFEPVSEPVKKVQKPKNLVDSVNPVLVSLDTLLENTQHVSQKKSAKNEKNKEIETKQKMVQASVDDFEKTLDVLLNKTSKNNEIMLDFPSILENEKKKYQQPKIEKKDYPKLCEDLSLNLDNYKKGKFKVIDVKKYQNQDTKLKVLSVEPKKIDLETAVNLIYKPFEQENDINLNNINLDSDVLAYKKAA